jgi:hypothetical protein
MTIDWQINGTVVLFLIAHLIGVVIFLVRAADRATRAEAAASQLESRIKNTDERITLEVAALSLFREQVARDYVSREAMREMEDRLVNAIDRLGDRLDRVIEGRSRLA